MFDALTTAHAERWTHADELLALVLERIDHLSILFVSAWGDPKKAPARPPTPFRYPRPERWSPPVPKQRTATADIVRFFRGR